jgi:hypothetical protein
MEIEDWRERAIELRAENIGKRELTHSGIFDTINIG